MLRAHISAAIMLILIAVFTPAADAVTEQVVKVATTDDVTLVGTLYLPEEGDKFYTILVRSPYGRHQFVPEGKFWADNGYAVLVQDNRGKFDTNGEYIPFLNEYVDGAATLDWIAKQEWSNGSVGMWGSSYLAFCQLLLASDQHPVLKSIMPISGWMHESGQIQHGGANHIMLTIPWLLHEESQTNRNMGDYEIDEMFEFLPLIDVFSSIGVESKIWNDEFDFSPLDAFSAANITIPALHITGWNDFVCGAALDVYQQARSGSASSMQKLMVGPWVHDQFYTTFTEVGDEDFGEQSAMGRERLQQLSLNWFNLTLKGESRRMADWPDVHLYLMGANEWRDFDSWPPSQVQEQKWYMSSDDGANTSGGDGILSTSAPSDRGTDSYIFDPNNPVPTYGGANFHMMLHLVGVKDQRKIEEREDVLVYTTPPLEEDVHISGPMRAVLYASTEGRDTDFTAKLVQVKPDGYARIIEEGIIRASYRNMGGERELLEPGEVYELTVALGSTAIVIPRGHRIRLEISSSNFPKYDRNPNTGEESVLAKTLQSVRQKIHHGGKYRSHVVLPVFQRTEHTRK